MILLPIILWWSIYYLVNGKIYDINKRKWFTGALVSLIISLITVPLLYYFYTGVFGIESVIIDIIILFLARSLINSMRFMVYHGQRETVYNIQFLLLKHTLLFYMN